MKNLLAVLLLAFVSTLTADAFQTVILDAGHGGHDRGATVSAVYEKHMCLDTARRVEAILKDKGYRVVMSRTNDYFISLSDRSRLGNSYSNAVFVSIHYNSASNTGASGLETFYYHSKSYLLAAYIQAYMVRNTGLINRGVKQRGFHVIRETSRNPAVLVECGFVSNRSERSKMMYGNYRAKIAESIAQGIIAFDRH